jgi:hypothetical protein
MVAKNDPYVRDDNTLPKVDVDIEPKDEAFLRVAKKHKQEVRKLIKHVQEQQLLEKSYPGRLHN